MQPADLVFEGGTIYISATETTSHLALANGVVVAIGADASLRVDQDTTVLDLEDHVVVPGLHDNHVHLLAGSFVLDRLVLLGRSSMDSILSGLSEYLEDAPDEPWLVGYGWVSSEVEEPNGLAIDALVSDRPVLLADNTGHTALVNSAGLERAGIDADTPDPVGGEIVRDENGDPTGYLKEAALGLVSEVALADFEDNLLSSGLVDSLDTFVQGGVTSVSEILASPGFDLGRPWIYQALDEEGLLKIRVHYYLPVFSEEDVGSIASVGEQYDSENLQL
ncbi:MAG: amidohydrolase family protein, partial [Myxococcota bacterium]|nr:amidohydrolase family protein [Myxococcota bacterium]